MWKYLDKESIKEFILSLNLVPGSMSDDKKIQLLYAISNHPEKYYIKKYIPKKDGTNRKLYVPTKTLKLIQTNILHSVLALLEVSKYATAYVKKKSIKDNAYIHVGHDLVLKLDIKDFFYHVSFEQLYSVLPNSIFPPAVKVLLLKLCTYEDYLPQGAPTSPKLSNLAMKSFDDYIGKYCEENGICYTRYSDDLTFSGSFDVKKLKDRLENFLDVLGFRLNLKKTRVLKKHQKQIITGVVVNQKLNASRDERRKIRQVMYYIQKFGISNYNQFMKEDLTIQSILGKVNYVLFLNSHNQEFKSYQKKLKTML